MNDAYKTILRVCKRKEPVLSTTAGSESIGESNVTSVSSGLLSFHGDDLGNFLWSSHLFLSS